MNHSIKSEGSSRAVAYLYTSINHDVSFAGPSCVLTTHMYTTAGSYLVDDSLDGQADALAACSAAHRACSGRRGVAVDADRETRYPQYHLFHYP